MKQCSKCLEHKPESDYNWRFKAKGVRQPYCRVCSAATSSKWYKTNKATHKEATKVRTKRVLIENTIWVYEYLKQHPCVECGESNPIKLEFDHIDPTQKDFAISKVLGSGYRLETLKAEIAKCQVLCANCHRFKTARQFNYRTYELWLKDHYEVF